MSGYFKRESFASSNEPLVIRSHAMAVFEGSPQFDSDRVFVLASLEDESGRNFAYGVGKAGEHVVTDGQAWVAHFGRADLAGLLSAVWPEAEQTIWGLRNEVGGPREWLLVIAHGGCQLVGHAESQT